MDHASLRSELGLHHSLWENAGEFAIPLRQIDLQWRGLGIEDEYSTLTQEQKEAHDDKGFYHLAKMLYTIVFRYCGDEILDKERQCLWFLGKLVSSFKETRCLGYLMVDH